MPLPQCQKLWLAKSAEEWKRVYYELSAQDGGTQLTVTDVLGQSDNASALSSHYNQTLIQNYMLFAGISLVFTFRQERAMFPTSASKRWYEYGRFDIDRIQHILALVEDALSVKTESVNATSAELVANLLAMHAYASIDHMEVVAGKEGQEAAIKIFPSLKSWVYAREARQAVWHASQVIRVAAGLPTSVLTPFFAVSVYHAILCIWTYAVLLQTDASDVVGSASATTSGSEEVVLNQEESMQSQRWIMHCRGDPVLSIDGGQFDVHARPVTAKVPLRFPQILLGTLLRGIMSRFKVLDSTLVQNICHLIEALGSIHQKAEVH